ncbi:galactose-1-epimerase [Deltaproteobacteria bacterium Smac51]|nr:galactose-1-epimerase [Deltaproteobacteria bacterium Smac51]
MIEKTPFGKTGNGQQIDCFRLSNSRGMSVDVLNLGCVIQSIIVPDRHGTPIDVVMGYDTVQEYESDDAYLGALIGRWANRISGAEFELDGRKYPLAANDGVNHLHGGPGGFHRHVWRSEPESGRVIFSRTAPDGEEGYPGNLEVRATYALTDDNELILTYEAVCDLDTIVNLTNHSYFNLSGEGDMLTHELTLAADYFSEVDEALIPTGKLLPVAGGPFDFRRTKAIGRDIDAKDPQLVKGKGYDHNFVLNRERGGLPFAMAASPATGLTLSIDTTLPGVQFYSGNALSHRRGKGGRLIGPCSGFCLETQLFPDSINQDSDSRPILKKGQNYYQTTVYKFTA